MIRDVTEPKSAHPGDRLLRLESVLKKTGMGRASLYKCILEGSFPAPVKLKPKGRAVAWVEREVDTWVAKRIAERDQAGAHRGRSDDECE